MTREVSFPLLLNERGLMGPGAEVGVARGVFSRAILDAWAGPEFHMVDSWRTWAHEVWRDRTMWEADHRDNCRAALAVASDFAPRVHVHPWPSAFASSFFPPAYFDWVYIDANHGHEAVCEDLVCWSRLVRAGGMLAGHDFVDGAKFGRPDIEVRRAVLDVFPHAHVELLDPREDFPSWWICMPA